MKEILEHVLTAPADPVATPDVEQWWRAYRKLPAFELPIERAMAGGLAADRPAFAFAAGYQETLRQLVDPTRARATAFCATEEGGVHPRAVQTTLEPAGDGYVLQGRKTFVTLGTFAAELLVVARTGERDGRPELALVRVDAHRAGVSLEPLPELPFVPEIPHAAVRLESVAVRSEERLDGDGYLRFLKPMRTVEDLHVPAALLAWVVGVARRSDWPTATIEDLCGPLAALHGLAQQDPLAPAIHVALAGVLRHLHGLLESTAPEWGRVDPATAERWQRDRALLGVAATARERRAEAAWKRLRR